MSFDCEHGSLQESVDSCKRSSKTDALSLNFPSYNLEKMEKIQFKIWREIINSNCVDDGIFKQKSGLL